MPKDQRQARGQIKLALSQSLNPIATDIVDLFPVVEDWFAVADRDVPHIHGIIAHPRLPPRPMLTAAVIGIETTPVLLIRCLDGCYRLGGAASIHSDLPVADEEHGKGRVSWVRFQRMIDAFVEQLVGLDDGAD